MNMITPVEASVSADDAARDVAREHGKQRRRRAGLAVGALSLIGIAAVKLAGGQDEAQAAPPPPTVTVAAPLEAQVTEWDDYVGRFAPSKSVEIRPRVSGALTGIHFRDGEIVRRGQLLFRIDPRPFQAALAEAQARAASADSALALARSALARAERLIADEAVSAEEVDTLRANVRAAEASVAAARAQVRARALDVEFTSVRAPITGRISDRRADVGNLVAGGEAASATLLTTIYALDPIYFTFDGSEALYLKARRHAGDAAPPVEIRLQDEAGYRWKGRIDFSDNGLDPRSGTVRGRAVVDNPDYFLTPGLFGNMRMANAGTRAALLVPDAAIGTDQARKIVQVVGPGNVVATRTVELGPVTGGLRIVRAGLRPGERVVIAGVQNAVAGAPVTPRNGRIVAARSPDATPDAIAPAAAQATFGAL